MRPRERRGSGEQDLFRSRLHQVINMDHALVRLAQTIDWRSGREIRRGVCRWQRPAAVADRLMAGLPILKHTYNLSEEVLRELWMENPYYQYFCGEECRAEVLR
jgi:transposase, IS5 family